MGWKRILGNVTSCPGAGKKSWQTSTGTPGYYKDGTDPAHLAKLLNSLQQILKIFPHTRIVIIGRPNLRVEIEKSLGGRVINKMLGPSKDDIKG